MLNERIADIGAQLDAFVRVEPPAARTAERRFRVVASRLPNPNLSGLFLSREEMLDGRWTTVECSVATSIRGLGPKDGKPAWLPPDPYEASPLTFFGLDLLWRKDEDEPLG